MDCEGWAARVAASRPTAYVEAGKKPAMNPTIPGQMVKSARPATIALLAVIGALLIGTLGLWAHYGTAVFYETILAGINACF